MMDGKEKEPGEVAGNMRTISRQEVKDKLDRHEEFMLVETLPRPAYEHEHLPQAINLPPDELQQLAPTLLPDKNAEIVVYCGSPT